MGCAVKEQGETSVLHDSIFQEGQGAACFPRLDGAHPRLELLVSSEADGIVLCFFPT